MCGAAGAPPITRDAAPPGLVETCLGGRCPRCGAETLFDGIVQLAPSCRSCGLDFSAFNVGDGPAAFLILILGTVVGVAAIVTELALEPHWTLHIVWVPILLVMTLAGLRVGNALILALEYRHDAHEGRLQ